MNAVAALSKIGVGVDESIVRQRGQPVRLEDDRDAAVPDHGVDLA